MFEYINKTYGVHAQTGKRIRYNGQTGEILRARNQYLIIKLDGHDNSIAIHPTWNVEYDFDSGEK